MLFLTCIWLLEPGRTCSVGSPPTSVILDQENDGLGPAQVVNENTAVCPSTTVALLALVLICGGPKVQTCHYN